MSVTISRDEWLKALNEAGFSAEHDEDAITVNDFAEMMGMTRDTADRRLRALVKAGKAAQTRKITQGRDGRTLSFIAFRLLA